MRHRLAVLPLMLLPLGALASERCAHEAPRQLQADLRGVRAVEIDVHNHDLHVTGRGDAATLDLHGRACASDQALLDDLIVSQRRDGDRLIVELGRPGHHWTLFGGSSSSLEVQVQLPAGMPLSVDVGSGDADVQGVRELSAHVGSGDLHARGIAGRLAASVGSGDVKASDIGQLELGSVGSGDASVDDIHGDARIGRIGSGDVDLARVTGSVHAQTLGSGDLQVRDVGGDFVLDAKGSGDASHRGVRGKVSVPDDD